MFLKTAPVENNKSPWYKEKLQTKYLRDLSHKQQLSGALDGRRWRFLSPGQDDFRDGYPAVHKELFTRCDCGPAPVVFGMPKNLSSVKLPQKRLSKDQACYSKQNPQSQIQRGFIDAVEHRLKQHPLTLYPHLERELFDQVLSVLELDMCLKQELATTSPTNEMQKEKYKETRPTNPYKWQKCKKTCVEDDRHLQEDDKMRIHRHLLGEDTSDMTESTNLELFKSDYEKKSPLSPIKKTDCKETLEQLCADDHHSDPLPDTFHFSKACEPNRPQTSNTCIKRASNEPLRSPSDIINSLDSEGQLNKQDEEPKQSYAIQAFRQYIINKRLEMQRGTFQKYPRSHVQFLSVLFCEEEQKNKIRASNTPGSIKV